VVEAEVHPLAPPALRELAGQVAGGRRQLLQAERDPPPLAVHTYDLNVDLLADAEDVLRLLDVVPAQLRDVEEPLDARQDLDEGAVLLGLVDGALTHGAARTGLR